MKKRILYKCREHDHEFIRIGTITNYEVNLDIPKKKEFIKPRLYYSEWYEGVTGGYEIITVPKRAVEEIGYLDEDLVRGYLLKGQVIYYDQHDN